MPDKFHSTRLYFNTAQAYCREKIKNQFSQKAKIDFFIL